MTDYPRKTMFEQMPEELFKSVPASLDKPAGASAPGAPPGRRTQVEQLPIASAPVAAPTIPPVLGAAEENAARTDPPSELVNVSQLGDCREYAPVDRPPTARLLILDDHSRTDGEWLRLRTARFVLGRTDGNYLLPHDGALSGQHAEIIRQFEAGRYQWYLHDLGSTNGTFVRAARAVLKEGQEVMLGMRRYAYRGASLPAGSAPGDEHATTRDWHAPSPVELDRMVPALVEIAVSDRGKRYPLVQDEMTLGSDPARANLVIRDDPFVSPVHATIKATAPGRWTIQCARSRNGLWVRIDSIPLDSDCEFQIGEQRCRFELP
jgi:hypothetical protein